MKKRRREVSDVKGSGGKEPFTFEWLALREPVDHRSRPPALLPPLREAWRRRGWSRILDLGCGTGSNLRYLAPRLPGPQRWTLLDDDPTLLQRIPETGMAPGVRRMEGDLAGAGLAAVPQADLVTASALLDLVSEPYLARLVEACGTCSNGVLLALSYDGRVRWLPSGEDRTGSVPADLSAMDRFVRQEVNTHQRRDKGLGPALGPEAGHAAERLFREAGFRTFLAPSPWELGADDAALAGALLAGWVAVASGERPEETDRVRAWARLRNSMVQGGSVALNVGHLDLLALPPGG